MVTCLMKVNEKTYLFLRHLYEYVNILATIEEWHLQCSLQPSGALLFLLRHLSLGDFVVLLLKNNLGTSLFSFLDNCRLLLFWDIISRATHMLF